MFFQNVHIRVNMRPTVVRLFFFLMICFFVPTHAGALTIAPLRQTAVVDPGDATTIPVFVVNDSDEAVTVAPEIDGFDIDSASGTPRFGVADAAKSWVTPAHSDLTLAPGETGQMTFVVSIPKDAIPGAHYLALFARSAPAEGQIGVASRVGMLLFLHVAGEVKEVGELRDFSAGTYWYKSRPFQLFVDIGNTGNIHVVPSGTITLRNWRDTVVAEQNINEVGDKILAGGRWQRAFNMTAPITSIGKIKARISIFYGATEQVMTDEIEFYYVPLWVVYGGVFVTGAVAIVIGRHVGKIKEKNKRRG